MSKDRRPAFRSRFDGHKRLAAAVIIQAIKDSSAPSEEDRAAAREFLQSDMRPFADVLDLPADRLPLRTSLENGHQPRQVG